MPLYLLQFLFTIYNYVKLTALVVYSLNIHNTGTVSWAMRHLYQVTASSWPVLQRDGDVTRVESSCGTNSGLVPNQALQILF